MTLFNWFRPKPPPPPRVDEVFNLSTITNTKETAMSVKMTGVWQRKDVEFADQQALERAKVFAMMFAPFTINSDPQLTAEYLAIYGADEAANLKASNMVQSSEQRYVKGGVWVEAATKSTAALVPGPDEEVLHTIFGSKLVKKGTTMPASTTAVMTLSHEEMESLVEETVLRCLKRVFPERF